MLYNLKFFIYIFLCGSLKCIGICIATHQFRNHMKCEDTDGRLKINVYQNLVNFIYLQKEQTSTQLEPALVKIYL